MNSAVEPMSRAKLKRAVIDFVQGASIEISPHDEGLLPTLPAKLPAGTTIYVAHTPKASLDDVVRVAIKVQSLGFRASPHIVARRLVNERELRSALSELRDWAGVEQVLLIGGDLARPVGRFTSALELLETGLFEPAEIKRVGIAGHPEGHKAIGPAVLWRALQAKQAFAERAGLKMHIVTQFGFSPNAVCAWERHLVTQAISLPVHVGIAGPTSLPRLIRFAMHCGVATSLHGLMKNMSAMSSVVQLATSPDEMVTGLVRGRIATPDCRLVQPHFYAFGGVAATLRWLRAISDGLFELPADNGKFLMA